MGIWKLALAILVGAMFTEKGRETVRKLTKQGVKLGQSVAENTCCQMENLKAEASKMIEDIKVEEKEKKQQVNN